jgi:large subunit ribosomal protein L14
MVQSESILAVADNTGVKKVKMIRRLGHLKDTAKVGDIIVVSVRETTPDAAIKKGSVVKAVIVRTAYPTHREDGSSIRFDDNAVVIIREDFNPRGTRVFGPVARELRAQRRFMKIISLAPEVL